MHSARKKIRDVLDAERIFHGPTSPFLAFRHSYDNKPTENDLTVVIDCRKDHRPWLRALLEIRKILMEKGLNFRIELLDFTRINKITHSILADHPVVSLWETSYKQKILSIMKNSSWQTINVLHRGFSKNREDCPVTLVITAWDAQEDKWWDDLLPKIRKAWPHKVDLQSARTLQAMDLDVNACASEYSMDVLTEPLRMGASVGISGEVGGGTLGGIVELQWSDGPRLRYALTNNHVVLEDKLRNATHSRRALVPTHPFACEGSLKAVSPCDADTGTWLKSVESEIARHKRRVYGDNDRPGSIGPPMEVEMSQEHKRPMLDSWLTKIRVAETELVVIRGYDRIVGSVGAASGDRTVTQDGHVWPLDWALIRLTWPMQNKILATRSRGLLGSQEGMEVSTWTDVKERDLDFEVTKVGRTTRWTDGRLNAIKSELRFRRKDGETKYDVYGEPVNSWCVPSSFGASISFASPGDSGSLLLDEHGSIVGLIFAAIPPSNLPL